MKLFVSKCFIGFGQKRELSVQVFYKKKGSSEVIELKLNHSKHYRRKHKKRKGYINLSLTVARPGFEPRQTAPKTVVLPLYYQAILTITAIKTAIGLQK